MRSESNLLMRDEWLSWMRRGADRGECIIDRTPIDRPVVGVEVGVLFAELSERVLTERPNLTMHLVDRWEAPAPDSDYVRTRDNNALRPADQWEAVYADARRRMERFGSRAIIHRMESIDAARLLGDQLFDWVFLDGDHSVSGCAADIAAWWPLVRPGGWIGGHDYNPRWGVPAAVDAFAASVHLPIERDVDSTWFVWRE